MVVPSHDRTPLPSPPGCSSAWVMCLLKCSSSGLWRRGWYLKVSRRGQTNRWTCLLGATILPQPSIRAPPGSLPALPSSIWFLSPSVSYTHNQTPGFRRRMLWALGTLTWGLLLPGAQSESAQSKMQSGIGGFVLGLIFLGVGLFVHFWDKRGKAPWEKKGEDRCWAEKPLLILL